MSNTNRTEDAAWLREQIAKLAKDAKGYADEDEKEAEGSRDSDRAVLLRARSETAAHYAKELRRILKGLTWDEDFVASVKAASKPLRRARR